MQLLSHTEMSVYISADSIARGGEALFLVQVAIVTGRSMVNSRLDKLSGS